MSKKFLAIVLVLTSCFKKNNTNESADNLEFTYTFDTVSIKSEPHLFNLSHGIPMVKLSQDEHYLYFFDDYNLGLEKINLDKNEFELSIPLEKEGPKGIGATFDYVPDDNGTIQLLTLKNLLSIDEQGILINSHPSFLENFDLKKESRFLQGAKISDDSQFIYGLASSLNQKQTLRWFNLKDNAFNEVFLDSMAYRKSLEIDLGRLKLSGMQEAAYFDSQIFVYHDDGIDFYVLDPISLNLKFHDFKPTKIPKRKEGNYPKSGSTADILNILEMEKLEINYYRMVYDSSKKRYYRIASQKRENQIQGGIPNQFLLIFSDDFKLIHEEDLSNLPFSITTYFVQKGKFWVFNKESEELEFFVFDFHLN